MSENTKAIITTSTNEKDRAIELNNQVKASVKSIATSYLELAKNLVLMQDSQLYKELGYEHFQDWAKQEADLSLSWCKNLMSVQRTLLDKLHVSPARLLEIADYSKIVSLIPLFNRYPEKTNEFLTFAKNSTREEIKQYKIKYLNANNPSEITESPTQVTVHVQNENENTEEDPIIVEAEIQEGPEEIKQITVNQTDLVELKTLAEKVLKTVAQGDIEDSDKFIQINKTTNSIIDRLVELIRIN